jgi:hypothetical protein
LLCLPKENCNMLCELVSSIQSNTDLVFASLAMNCLVNILDESFLANEVWTMLQF